MKLQNWQWHHRVSLVKTLRRIYELISKGQGQNLTLDQGHVITKRGNVAYQSTRINKTNTLTLARKRCFATFAHAGGGLVRPPPWRLKTERRRA